jgi:hypothetical protein
MVTSARTSTNFPRDVCVNEADGRNTGTLVGGDPTAKTVVAAANEAVDCATELEAQYGVGIFLKIDYQRHLHYVR